MKKFFIVSLTLLQLSCFSSCQDELPTTTSSDSVISSELIDDSSNKNTSQSESTNYIESATSNSDSDENTEALAREGNNELRYISDQVSKITSSEEYQKQSKSEKAFMLEQLLKELQEKEHIKEYRIELDCDAPYVAYECLEGERTVTMLSDFKFNKN